MQKFLLLKKISVFRRLMYVMAKRRGYTDPTVVYCSQKLDNLLNRYQNI